MNVTNPWLLLAITISLISARMPQVTAGNERERVGDKYLVMQIHHSTHTHMDGRNQDLVQVVRFNRSREVDLPEQFRTTTKKGTLCKVHVGL